MLIFLFFFAKPLVQEKIFIYRIKKISKELNKRFPITKDTNIRNRVSIFSMVIYSNFGSSVFELSDLSYKAYSFLGNGESEKAIALFEKLNRSQLTDTELEILGIAYLRLGEQQNCIHMHGQDSCLFPLRGMGIHRLKNGGEKAFEVFGELVSRDPNRNDWKWLWNISAMATGNFPKGIPDEYRILESQLVCQIEFPRFFDIAAQVGIRDSSVAGGSIMDDFNNDGFLDIVNRSDIKDGNGNKLYINNGKGEFIDKSIESGLSKIKSDLNFMQTDFNNDGFLDVMILRGAWQGKFGNKPISLLKNNRNGTFSEVTKEVGDFRSGPTQAAVWADFDNDGDLDFFLGCESIFSQICPSKFYENIKNEKFIDASKEVGLNFNKLVKGAIIIDYNNDGWIDLVISDLYKKEVKIFRNTGTSGNTKIKFVDEITFSTNPFSLASFDYNNDGWFDLLVPGYESNLDNLTLPFFTKKFTNLPNSMKLLKNNKGIFEDVSEEVKLNIPTMTMGLNFGDIDNDGYIDFFLGTGGPSFSKIVPNKAFKNNQGINFQDITISAGLGNLQKGHGISFGDYDEDGYLDIFSSLGGMLDGDGFQDSLYKNPGNNNNWVKISLKGTTANRFGIGSKIKVTTELGSYYRFVDTGGSFGANPLKQHIGIGQSKRINELVVYWSRNYRVETYKNLDLNSTYLVTEGEGIKVIK